MKRGVSWQSNKCETGHKSSIRLNIFFELLAFQSHKIHRKLPLNSPTCTFRFPKHTSRVHLKCAIYSQRSQSTKTDHGENSKSALNLNIFGTGHPHFPFGQKKRRRPTHARSNSKSRSSGGFPHDPLIAWSMHTCEVLFVWKPSDSLTLFLTCNQFLFSMTEWSVSTCIAGKGIWT